MSKIIDKDIYINPKQASKHFNVTSQTLKRWSENGKIKVYKTKGGHRRYKINEDKNDNRDSYIYARVSSSKQKEDLQRQVKLLQKRFPNHKIITDIGSAINFKRKGFKTILRNLFNGNVKEVVVAYKDRWSRFGFEMFEWIFQLHGSQLLVMETKYKTPEQELAEDLMSITTVFTARYYGSRKY